MAVLVLQALAEQRGAPGGGTEQEAPGPGVGGRPDQVADALEPEHRIEDVERHHRHAAHGVLVAGGDEARHRAGLGDALLEDLTVLAAWPERDGEFADKFNTMPKVVVSTTLSDPAWTNTTVVRDIDAVAELKEGEGGEIGVHGSATLARALHQAGLVDQWNLMVFPVILGSGKRLFPTDSLDKQKLELVETTRYRNGVQLHIYRPLR